MTQSLQKVNYNNRLIGRSPKVEECRKSGFEVAEWYAENSIARSETLEKEFNTDIIRIG